MFVIDLNLARYLGKTCCVRKYKKNGYREFDHIGTLTQERFDVNQVYFLLHPFSCGT